MTSVRDYHLEPLRDDTSKVVCNHCRQEIGRVRTAEQTPTGRQTDVSESQIERDTRTIVGEHLAACPEK